MEYPQTNQDGLVDLLTFLYLHFLAKLLKASYEPTRYAHWL
jgi:hypothetical protein